jgi:hypothetical protein
MGFDTPPAWPLLHHPGSRDRGERHDPAQHQVVALDRAHQLAQRQRGILLRYGGAGLSRAAPPSTARPPRLCSPAPVSCIRHSTAAPTTSTNIDAVWSGRSCTCTSPRLATTASVLGGVAGAVLARALRQHMAGTVFGARYDDTAGFDLPQLAVWLTAEVTSLLRAHPDPGWRRVRYATVARPTPREIRVNLHGVGASDECGRRQASDEDQRVLDDIWQLAELHNWHSRDEHRFGLILHVVTDRSAATLVAPGEISTTVSTDS